MSALHGGRHERGLESHRQEAFPFEDHTLVSGASRFILRDNEGMSRSVRGARQARRRGKYTTLAMKAAKGSAAAPCAT